MLVAPFSSLNCHLLIKTRHSQKKIWCCEFIVINIASTIMETHINKFGETITKWTSHKHPDNENFQQVVFWRITEKQCGGILVSYHLGDASYSKHLYNITKSEALTRFVD